ncbi:MAG: hypothetical protein ICV62_01365 [Cyanobacteria bacterium Co-bin13]|nr:hypothetical protein [Cyanobacteria bacterium Co-bin13]
MNGYTQYSNNRRSALEALVPETRQAKTRQTGLAAALKEAGQAAVNFLTSGNDLRIWTRQRNGHLIWHVYDPMTEQRQQFSSEADLRSWLETRYYE